MYKYILFDLDGTLTDSAIGIINGCLFAMKKNGFPVPDPAALYPFIGPPLEDTFVEQLGVTPQKAWEMVEDYRVYYNEKGAFENRVYDGIPDALRALKAGGRILATATSKPYESAVGILRHFGLLQYFDLVGAATLDGRIARKRDVITHTLRQLGNPDKSEVLMIGDRAGDASGAAENGIDFLGALYGYGSRQELLEAGARFFAKSPADIIPVIGEMEKC